jgi:hypothetical protein
MLNFVNRVLYKKSYFCFYNEVFANAGAHVCNVKAMVYVASAVDQINLARPDSPHRSLQQGMSKI